MSAKSKHWGFKAGDGHGGAPSIGKRKSRRPLPGRGFLQLTLKCSCARGALSLRAGDHFVVVDSILRTQAQKFGVRISRVINAGNQLHLAVSIKHRHGFQNFLRSVTALIARKVTGARRGRPFGRFWDHLACTHILPSRKVLKELWTYLHQIHFEAMNARTPRQRFLALQNLWHSSG